MNENESVNKDINIMNRLLISLYISSIKKEKIHTNNVG